MDASTFRHLWAQALFERFSQFGTFKIARVTINHEMHEQVHTIFYLFYIPANYAITLFP